MAKPRKQSEAGRIIWTGKNLADVRKFHKDVEHYPDDPSVGAHYRDASQHPDNLHIEVDGRTLVAALGDTIIRDEEGNLSVKQTGKQRPTATGLPGERQYQAEGREGSRAKGGTE